jgi:Rieske Fe-S protein
MPDNDQAGTHDAATRRTVLRGALIAGVATPLLAACASGGPDKTSSAPTTKAAAPPAAAKTSTGSGGSGSANGGGATGAALTKTADIPKGSGKIFDTEGVVVTQPTAGEFKGFSNICTHMGCRVHDVTTTINCICHGSQYSITDGSVVTGPATQALAAKPLKVSGQDIELV